MDKQKVIKNLIVALVIIVLGAYSIHSFYRGWKTKVLTQGLNLGVNQQLQNDMAAIFVDLTQRGYTTLVFPINSDNKLDFVSGTPQKIILVPQQPTQPSVEPSQLEVTP